MIAARADDCAFAEAMSDVARLTGQSQLVVGYDDRFPVFAFWRMHLTGVDPLRIALATRRLERLAECVFESLGPPLGLGDPAREAKRLFKAIEELMRDATRDRIADAQALLRDADGGEQRAGVDASFEGRGGERDRERLVGADDRREVGVEASRHHGSEDLIAAQVAGLRAAAQLLELSSKRRGAA